MHGQQTFQLETRLEPAVGHNDLPFYQARVIFLFLNSRTKMQDRGAGCKKFGRSKE
jgi:hypothetical protein